MRKTFLGVLAAVIVLSSGAATALAAGPGGGRYFADTDGDGICDNRGTDYRCSMGGTGCGEYFVDEDGDGICDNNISGQGGGYGRGAGGGHGFRGGRGR